MTLLATKAELVAVIRPKARAAELEIVDFMVSIGNSDLIDNAKE